MMTASPARMSSSWLSAQGRLPLAFMGLALAWLGVSTALLARYSAWLNLPHAHPQVVALTHAWVLGFFVTAACGAVYQLAPVALGTTLWSERQAWWHFGLHALGVPVMVYAFSHWNLALLALGGSTVGAGIVLFTYNTWRTVRRSARPGVVSWALALAAGWLLLTVLWGLTLAANRLWGFIPLDPLALLRAHAHLGLVGFFVTLLQGISFQLVPMFTLGTVRDWRLPAGGFWLSQAALVGLVPALLAGSAWAETLAGLGILTGFVCSGIALHRALATRKKAAFDPGLLAFLWGAGGVAVAAVLGLALVWPGSSGGSDPGGFNVMVYGVVAFAGGLLPCIAGMMCKIVPFLTWMRVYGPRIGRAPTPPATALAHPRLERWGLGIQQVAVLPLVAGVWLLSEPLLQLGSGLLAVGVVLFMIDMLRVLRHLWWPVAVSVSGKGVAS